MNLILHSIHHSILNLTHYPLECPEHLRALEEFQVIICNDDGESFCNEYLRSFNGQMKELSQSLVEFESRIESGSDYGLEAIDHVTNSANSFLDSSRSIMWRALRNKVAQPAILENPVLDEMVSESKTCTNTAKTANQLLTYISNLVESSPDYELETDDTGNIIVDWVLDSYSYEWTIAKSDDPWPMLKVYEYSRKRSRERQPPSVQTWHNAKSLGKRFKSIIENDQQTQKFIENDKQTQKLIEN